jgi:hypothetical protein
MSRDPREPILLIDDGAVAPPPALVSAGLETLAAAIPTAGARTSERFIDFFTANIRTRKQGTLPSFDAGEKSLVP